MPARRRANITLTLDETSGVSLQEQIYQKLRAAIQSGGLVAGELIPSVRTLSADLGVSHTTVEQAYLELAMEGYVRAVPRSGYVVEELDTSFFLDEREDVSERVRRIVANGSADGLAGEEYAGRSARFDFSYVNLREGSYPRRAWQRASSEVALSDDRWLTRYAYHTDPSPLKTEIARHLWQVRGVVCEPEQIILKPGSLAAISDLLQLFDPSKYRFAIEEPGWPVPRAIAAKQGFLVTPIDVDGDAGAFDGCLPDEATVAFLTPSHQFPTGSVMPLQARIAVLERARESGSYLIEDDSCSEYRYDMRPVPSLQSLDASMRTVYLGNFSKTLSPSLRIAYLVLPPDLLERYLGRFPASHPGVSSYDAQTLALLMSSGDYARHVRRMVTDNRRHHDELVRCLRDQLGDSIDLRGIHSGMHLYATVRNGMSTRELIDSALDCGAKVYSPERFWFTRPMPEGTLMIGFSSIAFEDIEPGVTALAEAWL